MATADVDAALTGGNYEVLRARLARRGRASSRQRADALNARRKALFGTTEPQLVATERVRTEHNCVPVDLVGVGDDLLLGFNVFLGLKAETKLADVLALHRFEPSAGRRRSTRRRCRPTRTTASSPAPISSATSRTCTATTATRG